MKQMSWRAEDQFDNFIFTPNEGVGFGIIQLRKKRDDNPDSYEYKIGKNAILRTFVPTENFANIITPKPPGEWIDLTLKEKELYLYLECVFSIPSRNIQNIPTAYKISSAKLITAEADSLPNNFSGIFQVKQWQQGYNYYETTLGRQLLAIFSKNNLPVLLYKCDAIRLFYNNINGVSKPVI